MNASQKALAKRRNIKHMKDKILVESRIQPSDMIHNRIAQFAKDHPEAEEYCLNSEREAGELLIYMAAATEHLASANKGNSQVVKQLNHQAGVFKGHFKNLTALHFIETTELTLHGLKLVVNVERTMQ